MRKGIRKGLSQEFVLGSVLMPIILMMTVLIVPAAAQEGPLTLEQCVSMALKSNLSIETASEKLVERDAAIEEASVANMPTFNAQASYTRVIPQPENPMAGLMPLIGGLGMATGMLTPSDAASLMNPPEISGNVYNIGLTGTYLIYTGGKIKNAQKITEHSKVVAEWQKKSAVREVRRDVTKAYYQALAANKGVVALDSAIALMEVMLKDLGNAVDVGIRGEHELLQAQVQLANQQLARQQAATGAQMAHDYLAMLIGVPVSEKITLVDKLHEPESYAVHPLPALQARARGASTDLKALEEQMKIVETSLLITGTSIPTPTVLARAGYTGQGIGQGKDGTWDNSGTISLVATWDIYDFGATNSKRRATLSQKRQLELGMEQLGLGLDLQVKNNCASLQDAFAAIETGKKSVAQTKRSYEISYDKFQEGMLLSSEVLNSQNMVLQAEISYYAALSTFYGRQADLDYMVNEEK
ncbi:MAG: TolC family protein [Chitinispirillia bacterium]|nr:TolC family protein [Chitinispirillia bacterium]MCL2269688.1 TolC family protein [Chitinispirillia bacterium]